MRRKLVAVTLVLVFLIAATDVYAAGLVVGGGGFRSFGGFHSGFRTFPRFDGFPRHRSLFITSLDIDVPLFYPRYYPYYEMYYPVYDPPKVSAFDKVEKSCTRQAPGRFKYRETAPSFYEKIWVEGRSETYDCSYYVPRTSAGGDATIY